MSIIGAAAIGAGASVLGSIFGGFGQNKTNETNLKIARETNEQNYKIWQEQMAHNIDLYNMQAQDNLDMYNLQRNNNIKDWRMQFDAENQYNTASAQRQRLEDAGLNPYLMMNGGSAGIANSNAPAPASMAQAHVNPSQAPTMQGYEYQSPMLSAINSGLQSLLSVSQALNFNADTDKKGAETININEDTRGRKIINDVNDKYLDYRTKVQSYIDFFNYKRTEKAWENDVAMQDDIQLHMKAMRIGQQLSNEQQEILNAGLSAQRQADLALTIAQEAETLARTDLTRKQIEEAAARITKMYWDNQLSKAMIGYYGSMTSLNQQTYQFNEDTNDLRIEGMFLDNTGKTLDNTGKRHDNTSKFLQNKFKSAVVEPMIENAIMQIKNDTDWQNLINEEGFNRGSAAHPLRIGHFNRWKDNKFSSPSINF